jgi:thiol-disulfide isomerase/thioredoxin
MRRIFGIIGVAGAIAVAVAATTANDSLTAFGKAIHSAESLRSSYTVQIIGSARGDYTISLKKPNMARIDTPAKLIVADGTNITTFEKAEKRFFREPQTEQGLISLFRGDELGMFAGFFKPDAYAAHSARSAGTRVRKDETVEVVEARVDAGGRMTVNYLLGPDKIARSAHVTVNDPARKVEIVIDTRSLEVNGPLSPNAFAFNAPAGAREVDMNELMSSKWFYNLSEAMEAAKASGRKIFVDFYADWCGPCKVLEAEVLQTEEFKRLSSKVVFLKIDVDRQKDVSARYKIEAMPTQMVLDANGNVLSTKVGYANPRDFYGWLLPSL